MENKPHAIKSIDTQTVVSTSRDSLLADIGFYRSFSNNVLVNEIVCLLKFYVSVSYLNSEFQNRAVSHGMRMRTKAPEFVVANNPNYLFVHF